MCVTWLNKGWMSFQTFLISLFFVSDVIHTVGPIAHGSVGESEEQALRDCYYNCLRTATDNQLRTVVREKHFYTQGCQETELHYWIVYCYF